MKIENSHTAREASTTGTSRPLLKFEMSVKRYAGSYVWNIILPLSEASIGEDAFATLGLLSIDLGAL